MVRGQLLEHNESAGGNASVDEVDGYRESGLLRHVLALADLFSKDVPLEDVLYLAGHANPRTTLFYNSMIADGGALP